MPATIEDLPYEILSQILNYAAADAVADPESVAYTYGITSASRPLHQKTALQKYIRGRVPTDVLRWNAVSAFRHVNSRWHQWALSFAVKELYIRRWRGGETWLRRAFNASTDPEHLPVVYQDPYKSVKATAKLFRDFPSIAAHVRRVWFNGIYRFNTIDHVFSILDNCVNVRQLSIPWTTLRYGSAEQWQRVLSFERLTSLEFLSVGLRDEIVRDPHSYLDTGVLGAPELDFSGLKRLKLFGDTNLLPVTDDDLIRIARTATNLQEILIANVDNVTVRGVAALVAASRRTLKLLDFAPTKASAEKFEGAEGAHLCTLFAGCPQLQDLAVAIPTICKDMFANENVQWHETVRLKVGSIESGSNFVEILEAARRLIEKREGELAIEIAVGPWLFDVKAKMVHGNFKTLAKMEGAPLLAPSVKGPYGYTGIHGDSEKGEWLSVHEVDFFEVAQAGLVRFGN